MLKLMRPTPSLPAEHPLLSYECHESDRWTPHEMDAFYQGLLKYNKDFSGISTEVGSKSTKQCVQFYYLWKRLCPEEYKRLRARHGKPKIKTESKDKDSKDTKELRDAIASVTEMDFSEEKSILHRTLVTTFPQNLHKKFPVFKLKSSKLNYTRPAILCPSSIERRWTFGDGGETNSSVKAAQKSGAQIRGPSVFRI